VSIDIRQAAIADLQEKGAETIELLRLEREVKDEERRLEYQARIGQNLRDFQATLSQRDFTMLLQKFRLSFDKAQDYMRGVQRVQTQAAQETFTRHKNGITINGDFTKEEWRNELKQVRDTAGSVHWQIGDFLVAAEKKWGEMYAEAEEITGFEYDTLRKDRYTASKIEFGRRRPNLSHSHHVEVASYKAEIQDILLKKAEDLKLSRNQFRAQLDSLLPLKGVQPGQWWKLGRHFLYCGDSASEDFKEQLTDVSFAFADPPYNAGVAEWDTDFTWKHNYLSDIASIVAVTPGISAIRDFMQASTMPYKWSMSYWINNGMTRGALGFGNWIYVALFTSGSLHRNEQDWERIPDLEVSITGGDHDPLKHKGRKPIAMMRHIIELFTKEDETVVDPFLGTGTTLIACEELGRSCIGAELSAGYCEAIMRRWEKLTGQEAEVMQW
jgi:hypothetical protein